MEEKDLTRRDYLAGERTRMARERTFLAYIRTAISMIVLGAVLIHFFEVGAFVFGGVVSIALGIVGMLYAVVRFKNLYR